MRREVRIHALDGLGGLLLGLGISWAAGAAMVAADASDVPPAPPPALDFHLPERDGTILAATYRPGGKLDAPAVLLLHGVGASRAATAPNAEWLASQRYAVLTIDFRGHGQSSLKPRTRGLAEARDARAAFDWLKRRQHGAPVAVIGISLGGAASLLGTSGPLPADALVLQAVYPDIRHAIRNRIATRLGSVPALVLEPLLSFQAKPRFGVWPAELAPVEALPRYRGPVLVIGGEHDRSTPPAESRAMVAAARGPKSLWLIPEGDHPDVCDARDETYRAHVGAFLARSIGPPPSLRS